MIKILVVMPAGPVIDAVAVLQAQAQHIDPMRFGRMYVWSDIANREDAYNKAVASADGYEFILFWQLEVRPYMTNALQYLLDLALDNEQASFVSWIDSFSPECERVFSADAGFMLARTEAFAKLEAEVYEVEGVPVKRYFTENDLELGDKCKAADVRWYVHGGAVCVREEAA